MKTSSVAFAAFLAITNPSSLTNAVVMVEEECTEVPEVSLIETLGATTTAASFPAEAIEITHQGGTTVEFQITQVWSSSDVAMLSVYFHDSPGSSDCDVRTGVPQDDSTTYTADCTGGYANVNLFAYTGASFTDADCEACDAPADGATDHVAYYLELPCKPVCETDAPTPGPTEKPQTPGPTSAPVPPSMAVRKTVTLGESDICIDGSELVEGVAGSAVTYCYKLQNTGGSRLCVTVLDDELGATTQSCGCLEPGEMAWCPPFVTTIPETVTPETGSNNFVTATGNPVDENDNDLPGEDDVYCTDPAGVKPIPVTAAPVTPAPVTSAPVTTAPVTSPPVTSPPVTSPPVTSPPVTTPPATSPPATTAPVPELPNTPAPVGCPGEMAELLQVIGTTTYPGIPITVLSQDVETVTFRIENTFTETVPYLYTQYVEGTAGSTECFEEIDVDTTESFEYTAYCMKHAPVTLVDIWIKDCTDSILVATDDGEVPDCCHPADVADCPTVQYTFKLDCSCPETGVAR